MKTANASIPDRIMKHVRPLGAEVSSFPATSSTWPAGQRSIKLFPGSWRAENSVAWCEGLYDFPNVHPKLGPLLPAPDDVAQALARESGSRVQISGARAANQLGLSTQVVAKSIYLTDGPSHRVVLGRRVIDLRHAPLKLLIASGSLAGAVVQALRHIGPARAGRGASAFRRRQKGARIHRGSSSRLDAVDASLHRKSSSSWDNIWPAMRRCYPMTCDRVRNIDLSSATPELCMSTT